MKHKLWFAVAVAVVAISVLGVTRLSRLDSDTGRHVILKPTPVVAVDYVRDVRPILDRRCVVCHGCYDAPCQLKLSSSEGISRGASKEPVYDFKRLTAIDPTRLFIDATSTEAWRHKGFSSVTDGSDASASLLKRMLNLGRTHPVVADRPLPETVKLNINRQLACPATAEEFADYASDTPSGGMPYGTAPLSEREFSVLSSWAATGAPAVDPAPEYSPEMSRAISDWETLLNGAPDKARLSARYIYEHLFLAHLYFTDVTSKQFFRLVRSRTAPGKPIIEVDTRHPNNDPGPDPFFYRLRPIAATIVAKTHITYPLSTVKLDRVRALFFDAAWEVSRLPGYATGKPGDPFATFADIPARSRYQFMLDEIRYTIMTFIRGPVCRGQVALDVINDDFFVAFLDPDYDLSITDPRFLEQAKSLIKVPDASASPLTLVQQWRKYYKSHRAYLLFREDAYFKYDPAGKKVTLDAIWPGNEFSPVSLLTVFRHFNSASVVDGFVGEFPKNLWVIDFPILERIYYNLVLDFDVFGNATHQLLTRLYMDYMRMEAEDLALGFLSRDRREAVRASWYIGAEAETVLFIDHSLPEKQRPSAIKYTSDDEVREFMAFLVNRFPGFATRLDSGNPLAGLSGIKGGFVQLMPDLSLLKVEGDDKVYTLIHNKAHDNVAFIFNEDLRRRPEDDTLTVIEGIVGNYPNFFFRVPDDGLARFADSLKKAVNEDDFERMVETYGVRRTSPDFWSTSDWFNDRFAKQQPIRAGLLDLNRYENF